MVLEEEIPESLEDLKKEIEELEESLQKMGKEITVVETEAEEKAPSGVEEPKFRVASIFVGYLIYVGTIIGLGFLIRTLNINDLLELLVVSVFLSVPALNIALGQATPSLVASPRTFVDLVDKWIYEFSKISFLDALKPYGLLLLLSLLPSIISGVVVGGMNKDRAYGFAAGVFVWLIALIISLVLILAAPDVIGISGEITTLIMDMITYGYLSALFLAIFGVMGGGMRSE